MSRHKLRWLASGHEGSSNWISVIPVRVLRQCQCAGALVTISNGNGVDSSTHVALNCIIRYAAGGSWSLKMSLASSQSPCMVS